MSQTAPVPIGDELSEPAIDERAVARYEADNSSALAVRSIDDIKRLSSMFITSGMFKGDKSLSQTQQLAQACVKIVAGVEFGIQPFAAVRGINIINGNAEMSANLMAAKVKKHPKYDYRVTHWESDGCRIEFYELPRAGAPRDEWDKLGESAFMKSDAEAAGLMSNQTWRKFPRNMYFARAISNGVRIFTPDVFYGAPVYVEGEISAEVSEAPNNAIAEPTEAPATAKSEAEEGEIVAAEAPATETLEDKLDKIDALRTELGHGADWFVHVSELIKTVEDADNVLRRLQESKISKEMSDD